MTLEDAMEAVASAESLPAVEPQVLPENGAEPMEVEQGPAVSTAAPAQDDPLQGNYTWEVKDFSKLPERLESSVFEAGGYPWKLLCFPWGNNHKDSIALYLVADHEEQPPGWSRTAHFKLTLINHANPGQSFVKEATHNFSVNEIDWGFNQFIQLASVRDKDAGFLTNDSLTFRVDVTVSPPDDLGYDSKKETGFVGLKNQGATCYMNSLLQTLYNINIFRRAVYHMPTSEEESPSSSMPLALQSVFYKLQFGKAPVSTKDLTQSFGWDTSDAFQQHDVQELNRILCEKLEEKMKGTRVEGMVNKLFEGQMQNYINCINVDYKSSRKEAYMDVQLDVKGCRNVYDSFDKYCEVETLEGDNQYNAEGHGMQDARKGILFESFPPVLQLQLKRFEYDFMKDAMVKINDRYEFYDELDLDRERADGSGKAYLSPTADPSSRNLYRLLAVLVHSGGVHGGHYYAYIRPDGHQWLKFDDEKVERSEPDKAVRENWGGEDERPLPPGGLAPFKFSKIANAYMLVYVRASEWDEVMCPVTLEDISDHVRARLAAEQEEKERRKREKAEAHLYTLVRVATDADLRAQIGDTRFFDLVDHDKVKSFKLPKKAPFSEVRRLVAEQLGVPPEAQRFWRWAGRQNATFRPSSPLLVDSDDTPISAIKGEVPRGAAQRGAMSALNLYVEGPQPGGALPSRTSKADILIFIKMFSPGGGPERAPPRLHYVGQLLMHKSSKVQDMLPLLARKAGLPDSAVPSLDLYEEVKFEPNVMIDLLNPKHTLEQCQLEDGDIVIMQLRVPQEEQQNLAYPSVKEYLTYVRFRLVVRFKRLDAPSEEGLMLELRADLPYEAVSEALAAKLGLDDPLKLRFTGQNAYSGIPRPSPIRWKSCQTLADLLKQGHYGQSLSEVLYYEVLDLPLPEFERLITFRISFYSPKLEEVAPGLRVRVPRDSSVQELLEALRAQLAPEQHRGRPLRLMEIYQWKIWQIFDPASRVETIGETAWHLRAEAVPPEEEGLGQPGALHVHCLQISREEKGGLGRDDKPTQKAFAFSDPFIMAISEAETVGSLRQRVQRRLELPDEEFEKWGTFHVAAFSQSDPLPDDAVISQRIPAADLHKLYGHHDRQCIGFEHENKNPRRTHAHINRNPSFYGQEKQLKIKA